MILLFSLFFNQVCRSIYEKNPGPDTDIPLSEVYVRLGDLQRFNGKVVCVCVCLYERERERDKYTNRYTDRYEHKVPG